MLKKKVKIGYTCSHVGSVSSILCYILEGSFKYEKTEQEERKNITIFFFIDALSELKIFLVFRKSNRKDA